MLDRVSSKLRQAFYQRKRSGAFQRPFDQSAARKLLLLSVDHRIPQSQLFPFHYYAGALRRDLDMDVREVVAEEYGLEGHPKNATTICFQTQFDISDEALVTLVARIRARNPKARLIYLDWFAPTDLRLAARVGPLVDAYVSKHVLRDRARYGEPTFGDTTLMDHYGRAFGLTHTEQHFPVPEAFWDKLHLGPSFATADFMLPVFARGARPQGARPIDLHARIAVGGTPWYAQMRAQCAAAVDALDGVNCVTGTGIRHHLFLRELRGSKLCFSPFGYGEVCWRDYEAVMTGAVLIKQDMSHVETDPDIFLAHETYVPVRWDLSDFADVVRGLLDDAPRRKRIAEAAFARLQDYARAGRFVSQMRAVIAPEAGP
ncbi:glycosyltransferase family 1 protein [Roseovarius sp. LXJ103]|uniref:hypothetical protein n=1 Tax=Roseovarius carneus TaxID=2853164 RepID=UPI000D604090|nr:hypothetical protein [Roseovarius carneus]MBZ8119280.1 glycosyltransferase family 1 protein [Roseovarius carneus]PWE35098.1 hypothetical protein DD563_03415 [Pelagicola sp. LXJ1103]